MFTQNILFLDYVGVTRAKKSLIILTNDQKLPAILPSHLARIKDHRRYPPIGTKTLTMTLEDVVLSFSGWHNRTSKVLIAGTKVTMK